MDFRKNDPGAVQYGNFINYYQFNSAEERLKLLSNDTWIRTPAREHHQVELADDEPYIVLDVGCNSGVFTQMLHNYLSSIMQHRKVLMYGIDIDSGLIARAIEVNDCDKIQYDCVDVMDDEAFEKVTQYLKDHKRLNFDAICCFSITMWIHLNHHDKGLQEFLRKLSSLSQLFVVEPQPWKCYQSAERRLKKSGEIFPLFRELAWRTQVEYEIQNFLERDIGRTKVFESCPTKWKRKICFYR